MLPSGCLSGMRQPVLACLRGEIGVLDGPAIHLEPALETAVVQDFAQLRNIVDSLSAGQAPRCSGAAVGKRPQRRIAVGELDVASRISYRDGSPTSRSRSVRSPVSTAIFSRVRKKAARSSSPGPPIAPEKRGVSRRLSPNHHTRLRWACGPARAVNGSPPRSGCSRPGSRPTARRARSSSSRPRPAHRRGIRTRCPSFRVRPYRRTRCS